MVKNVLDKFKFLLNVSKFLFIDLEDLEDLDYLKFMI